MCKPTDIESDPPWTGLSADDVNWLRGEERSYSGSGVDFGCAKTHLVCHVCFDCYLTVGVGHLKHRLLQCVRMCVWSSIRWWRWLVRGRWPRPTRPTSLCSGQQKSWSDPWLEKETWAITQVRPGYSIEDLLPRTLWFWHGTVTHVRKKNRLNKLINTDLFYKVWIVTV